MKQMFYIVKENESCVIYKVDRGLVPEFEVQQKENILIKAEDLKDLILQFDRNTLEKLELNKRIRCISAQSEYKNSVAERQRINRNNRYG